MSVLLPEHAWASAGVNRDLETGMAWMFDRPQLLAILAGAAGGTMAIGGMEAFSIREAFPLFAIPFATSIVTVLGSPRAEPAQPRALVGGHLLSTLVGLLVVKLCGPAPWAAGPFCLACVGEPTPARCASRSCRDLHDERVAALQRSRHLRGGALFMSAATLPRPLVADPSNVRRASAIPRRKD